MANQPIRVLPAQLANQIAAGEVVERPASVVKELLENSLDANATQIHIEVELGGQKRILIRDNGKGIQKQELALALSRHATSKIQDLDDLECITTMGFRGEALASISSVSRLTLTSKPSDQQEAWQAKTEGRDMDVEVMPAAHPDGTSIEVLDLFFNTPARRKFLRTGKTEFQHIEQVVKRIAMARHDVQFVLIHNAKQVFRYRAVSNALARVEQVCGKQNLAQCVEINFQYENISLNGWCSSLGAGALTRDFQYTFVNGRMMKDKLLTHALRQVYEDTLAPQNFPIYILYLQVPHDEVDVNVHPAKHEVRFHQARQIHDLVFKAVNQAISPIGSHVEKGASDVSSHDYILPLHISTLQPSQRDDAPAVNENVSKKPANNSSNFVGYRGNTPTKQDIKAHQTFYQDSVPLEANLPSQNYSQNTNKQTETAHSNALNVTESVLYQPPYLVFSHISANKTSEEHTNTLFVLHIQHFLSLLIKTRIQRSTLSQALLMPVSVTKQFELTTSALETLQTLHFNIVFAHQKFILKSVPSELRHLPWASIFSQLPLDKCDLEAQKATNPEVSDLLAMHIALAWLNTLDITSTSLSGWLSELDHHAVVELCQHAGKALLLNEWMQQTL